MSYFFGFLFGSIGGIYLVYAKRNFDGPFALSGIILMVYSYFVSSLAGTLIVGLALCAAPFAIRRLTDS